jgi:hypothetical protein
MRWWLENMGSTRDLLLCKGYKFRMTAATVGVGGQHSCSLKLFEVWSMDGRISLLVGSHHGELMARQTERGLSGQ